MANNTYICYTEGVNIPFEWDAAKDLENQEKHGVSFMTARLAFIDTDRIISPDSGHSEMELRFYCFGRVGEGIMTVRFTFRDERIRIIGAGYWRKGKAFYEKENRLH